jgi:GH43 family beta-xylosidase
VRYQHEPHFENGKVFVAYSASATDYNYRIGLLTANADAILGNGRGSRHWKV